MPWGRLAVAVIAGAVGTLVLQRYDVPLMRWSRGFMPVDDGSFWDQVLIGFKDFSQILTVITICIVVGVYDRPRRRWIITAIILGQVFANIAYNTTKRVVARHRPHYVIEQLAPSDDWAAVESWVGWKPGNWSREQQSFPSGHTTAAFALAGVLVWYYPPLRWLLWILAAGCGVTRWLHAAHWPSDCVAGAAIGFIFTCLALRTTERLMPRQEGEPAGAQR